MNIPLGFDIPKAPVLAAVSALTLALGGLLEAQVTPVGGIAREFTLTNRATGQPLRMTDFAGKVLVLDFFAYWCGPCQASSPDVETNIQQYYAARGGNSHGVPVQVLAVSVDPDNPSRTDAFVANAGLELAADDPLTANGAWSQFSETGGIPLFVIINCVAGSPSHAQWKVLYKQAGYAGAAYLRSFINTVEGAAAAPDVVIEHAGATLTDGTASVSFGSVALGASSAALEFTVRNTGAAELTGLVITKDGANASDFTVAGQPASTVGFPDGQTSFTVRFAPGGLGQRTATLHLASNDPDESPFDITLTGGGSLEGAVLPAPELAISGGNVNLTVKRTEPGCRYQLQQSADMKPGSWQDIGSPWAGNGQSKLVTVPRQPALARCYYRLMLEAAVIAPDNFVRIAAGSFVMGNAFSNLGEGGPDEIPSHTVILGAFDIQKKETTKAEWDEVRTWGLANGYTDLTPGSGKGPDHPVQTVSWYDVVKWCNARSEMEGLTPCYYLDDSHTARYRTGNVNLTTTKVDWNATGYRLPTEAEWERAARGGLASKRFPWGDSISHNEANFRNAGGEAYQTGTTGYHPVHATNGLPYSAAAASFTANGCGLHNIAGNVREWCWDWYGAYTSGTQTAPTGASWGTYRVLRGGAWGDLASGCRVADRLDGFLPGYGDSAIGFRPVRTASP